MPSQIPDLWRMKEDALRLYLLYLSRLQTSRRHKRVVAACRQIRRYAARGPGLKQALFTFSIEIDALCDLKKYRAAWRALRVRERILFGKQLNHRRRRWTAQGALALRYDYCPVLYFLGRYRTGCTLLETALALWLRDMPGQSFELLHYVSNGEAKPSNRCRVTLQHFYDRLGKDLREWELWDRFIDGLHPELFRFSKIRCHELRRDPRLLDAFRADLAVVIANRCFSRVSQGQDDLVHDARRVRKRQKAIAAARARFDREILPAHERLAKLKKLFPELHRVPTSRP
jgi:hypothetical protein